MDGVDNGDDEGRVGAEDVGESDARRCGGDKDGGILTTEGLRGRTCKYVISS